MRSSVLVSFLHFYLLLLDFFFSTPITVLWMLCGDAVLCICWVVGAVWWMLYCWCCRWMLCGDAVGGCCVVMLCVVMPCGGCRAMMLWSVFLDPPVVYTLLSCTSGLKLGPCYLLAVTLDIACLDRQYHPPLGWAVYVLSRLHLPFRQPDLCCILLLLLLLFLPTFCLNSWIWPQSWIFSELECPGKLLTPPDLSGHIWASFVELVKKQVFKTRNSCKWPECGSFSSEKVTTLGDREKRWVSFGQWKPQYVVVSFSLASVTRSSRQDSVSLLFWRKGTDEASSIRGQHLYSNPSLLTGLWDTLKTSSDLRSLKSGRWEQERMAGAVLDKARLHFSPKDTHYKAAHGSITSGPRCCGLGAERPGVRGQPQLCSEFEASLGYMKTCLKNQPNKKQTDKGK